MVNFPTAALKAAESNLNDLYTKYSGVGIVCYSLCQSQMSYVLLQNINAYAAKNPYFEICLYNLQKELPILVPHCAIYQAHDLNTHEGPLVAADPNSFFAAQIASAAKLYYYVYDVALLKYISSTDLEKIRTSGAKFFTRSKDHIKFLKKNFQIDTIDTVVPDWDIDAIRTIVEGKA
jgi:hypothetical protein